jgi:hypothetical protein
MNADTGDVIREGAHVRVIGVQHPQAGKTGVIAEILGVRVKIGEPRALIALDDKSGFICVTIPYLMVIP